MWRTNFRIKFVIFFIVDLVAIRVDTTLYHLHHSFSFSVQRNPSPCLYSSKLQARPSSSPTSLLLPLLRSPSPSRFFISRPLLSPSASLQSLFFSIYNNTICFIASHLFSSSKSACCDFCKLAAAVPSLGCITTVFILCLVPSIAAAPLIGIIFIDDIISSPVHSLRPLIIIIIIISLLSSSFFFCRSSPIYFQHHRSPSSCLCCCYVALLYLQWRWCCSHCLGRHLHHHFFLQLTWAIAGHQEVTVPSFFQPHSFLLRLNHPCTVSSFCSSMDVWWAPVSSSLLPSTFPVSSATSGLDSGRLILGSVLLI